MKNKITWAILISLLALFLRVYLALTGPFEFDEQVYFSTSVQYNLAMRSGDWNQILNSTANTEHPQFYKLVYAAGLLPFHPVTDIVPIWGGDQLSDNPYWPKVFSQRLISVVFGTATVFILSLINPLAGLFLAVDTMDIKYTSVIYLEALPQLLCLVSLLGAMKALERYQGGAAAGNWRLWLKWLLLSALAMGIAAASKYMYGVTAIAIGIAVIWRGWSHRWPVLLGLAGWGILCAVFFVAFDPVLWNGPIIRLSQSFQFSLNYQNLPDVVKYGYPVWQPILWLTRSIPQYPNVYNAPFFMNKGDYFISGDSLIFILGLVGLVPLWKKNMPMAWWLLVGIIFLMLWGTKWPQYVMLVLPAFCLSAGYGAELLLPYLPGGKASIIDRFGRKNTAPT